MQILLRDGWFPLRFNLRGQDPLFKVWVGWPRLAYIRVKPNASIIGNYKLVRVLTGLGSLEIKLYALDPETVSSDTTGSALQVHGLLTGGTPVP